jgi:hypothetical protein
MDGERETGRSTKRTIGGRIVEIMIIGLLDYGLMELFSCCVHCELRIAVVEALVQLGNPEEDIIRRWKPLPED